MQPLTLADIAPRERYQALRDGYRARIIELKRQRRVAVGDRVSIVFENRETLRFQVQEMCRVERIDDPRAVQHELDVYNELIPAAGELSATLFIEIPQLDQIRSELDRLIGLDEHVWLEVGGTRIRARFDDKQMEEDRLSAVQYIRFPLPETARETFADADTGVTLRIEHPRYQAATQLGAETRAGLAEDLRGHCPPLLGPEQLAGGVGGAVAILEESPAVRVLRLGEGHILVEPLHAGEDDALAGELLRTAQRHARGLGPDARIEIESGGDRARWHVRAGAR